MFQAQAPGGSAASDSSTSSRPGGDFGDGELFKEIGNTLNDVALQAITGAVVGLRTAVARQALSTQEGQIVTGVQQTAKLMPIILIIGLALAAFLAFRLLRR